MQLEALNPQAGARVLDLGCGTGVIARRLAECVDPTGPAIGLDSEPGYARRGPVRAVLGFPDVQSPCGRNSIRFNMRGQIIPCMYWPLTAKPLTITDLAERGEGVREHLFFQQAVGASTDASDCRCQGGCASRRALDGNLAGHDEYCLWARGEVIDLLWQPAPELGLVRGRNVCTTIVI